MVVDLERVKLAMVFSEFVGGSPENSNLAKNTPIFLSCSFLVSVFLVEHWSAIAKYAPFTGRGGNGPPPLFF